MLNLAGCLVILIAAFSIAADAHGADMGQKAMIEPVGVKLIALIAKYPLLVAGLIGSIVGAAVISAYQKKDRLKQFLINASIGITLTPFIMTFLDAAPTVDRWAACALGVGIFSGLVLKILISPEVQDAFKHAIVHQIDERLGNGHHDDEKAKAETPE